MDLDLIPLPHAPPIHEHLNFDLLNLAQGRRYSRSVGERLRGRGVPANAMRFNCGLIGVPRRWAPFLERLYGDADPTKEIFLEQGDVNIAIYREQIGVNVVDQRWNWFLPRSRCFDPALQDAYFRHFPGLRGGAAGESDDFMSTTLQSRR